MAESPAYHLAQQNQVDFAGMLYEADPLPGMEEAFDRKIYELLYKEQAVLPDGLNEPHWRQLENYFHQNGATLVTVTREFLYWNRDLEDPFVAMGRCDKTSDFFLELLMRRGVLNSDDIEADKAAVEEIRYDEIFFHAWNRVGNIHIDWTYRQFKPDSPFPFIFHERQMPDAWKEWRKIIDQRAEEMGF